MKKTRNIILGAAVGIGILGSFAFRSWCFDCNQGSYLFRQVGGTWEIAGVYGIDFVCDYSPTTPCDYYDASNPGTGTPLPGDNMVVCGYGQYCTYNCLIDYKNGGKSKK